MQLASTLIVTYFSMPRVLAQEQTSEDLQNVSSIGVVSYRNCLRGIDSFYNNECVTEGILPKESVVLPCGSHPTMIQKSCHVHNMERSVKGSVMALFQGQ